MSKKDIRDKIIRWLYRQKAKIKLKSSKMEDLAVFGILELYLTERIVEGDTNRRSELGEMQRRIEETEQFITFLNKIK